MGLGMSLGWMFLVNYGPSFLIIGEFRNLSFFFAGYNCGGEEARTTRLAGRRAVATYLGIYIAVL